MVDSPSAKLGDISEATLKTVFVLNPNDEAYFRKHIFEHINRIVAHIDGLEAKKAAEGSPAVAAIDQILKFSFADGKRIAMKVIGRDDDTPPPTMLFTLAAAGWSENIVRYNIILDSQEYRLVFMDDCPAGDLELDDGAESAFSEDGLRCIMRGALLGLSALHSCQLVHCDIKTSNILCSEQNFDGFCMPNLDADTQRHLASSIKLVDLSESQEFGQLRGTLGTHLAPEIWKEICEHIRCDESKTWTAAEVEEEDFDDLCPAGPSEDSWCLGIAFFELLTNEALFDDDEIFPIVATGDYSALCKYFSHQIARVPQKMKEHGFTEAATDFLLRLLALEIEVRPTARDALHDSWLSVVSI